MGDPYNNVGATGLVARSNHYCPFIMGDNIICWQLGGDNGVVMDRVFVGYTLVNQPSLDQPMYDIYYIMGWIIHYCTIRHWTNRCWTGRPDRSPLHSWGGHYWIAFWQNVKRRGLQCPSSHQNTVWWIRRAFSSDSQNTDWCRQGCWNNIPEGVGNGWVSFFCFRFLMVPFLLPSDLLTAPFF